MKVRLEKSVARRDSVHTTEIILEKFIDLPFAPIPGIELGLDEKSDLDFNADRIERVMYVVPHGLFIVSLEPEKHLFETDETFYDYLRWFLNNGWHLQLGVAFSNAQQCKGCDGHKHIVEIDTRFYLLDESELQVLAMDGRKYLVHPRRAQ